MYGTWVLKVQRLCLLVVAIAFGTAMVASASSAEALEAKQTKKQASKNPPVVRAPTEPLSALPTDPLPGVEPEAKAFVAPSCINVRNIRQARVKDDRTVILALTRKRTLAMNLRGACHGLAFDESFYYQPSPSGEICARLDFITARSGSRCMIEAFQVVPKEALQTSRARSERE
jgi:Family of unknown function (DUF6491)